MTCSCKPSMSCLSLSVCLSVCLSACLPVCLSVCLVWTLTAPSCFLFLCLYVCLSGVDSDGTKLFPVPVSVCGMEILGIPIGCEQFVTEKCVKVTESEDRPDIVFFDLESGHDVELDISLSHPWSLDTIRQAGQEDGYAALKEKVKRWRSMVTRCCCVAPGLTSYLLSLGTLVIGASQRNYFFKIGREVQICWGCQVCGRIHHRLEKTTICFITELQQQSNIEEDCSPLSRTFRNGQI